MGKRLSLGQKLKRFMTKYSYATVRQLFFLKEFRIRPSSLPKDLAVALEKVAQAHLSEDPSSQVQLEEASIEFGSPRKFIADLGTNLWRLRTNVVQPGTNEPLEEMRRAHRHLQAAWEVLTEAGIEVQDHTDMTFSSGMSLKVLAFQPMEGIEKERVVETVKPTIYYKGRSIQIGEVIVGIPRTSGEDDDASNTNEVDSAQ